MNTMPQRTICLVELPTCFPEAAKDVALHVVEHEVPEPLPAAAQPALRSKATEKPYVPQQPARDVLGPFRSTDDGLTPPAYEDQ
jgi:hypothetical protein